MTDELKPCPFCGGEAETCSYYFEEKDMTVWQVRCKERPYAVEHPCYTADSFTSFATEAEAVEAWNTRAERTFPDDTQEAQYHLCELERITGETWRPERTCHIVAWYVASSRAEIGRESVKLSCGHIVERHAKFCKECGARVVEVV